MEYGKRLSELLMEQQEPFLLDEYLKQNGYSRRAPKCHQISGLCCPLSVCKKLLKKRSSRGSTGGSCSTALRSMLNKIMYQKVIRKLMNWGCGKKMEFRRLDNSFERDSIGEDDDWRKMEVSSRQLSPVSVFELHSDEDSSPSNEYRNCKFLCASILFKVLNNNLTYFLYTLLNYQAPSVFSLPSWLDPYVDNWYLYLYSFPILFDFILVFTKT